MPSIELVLKSPEAEKDAADLESRVGPEAVRIRKAGTRGADVIVAVSLVFAGLRTADILWRWVENIRTHRRKAVGKIRVGGKEISLENLQQNELVELLEELLE